MFSLTIEDQNGQITNRFTFDQGSYTIGRMETCDIVLASTSVSRQHARVFVQGGRCFIEDLGSANGVLVDGQRVGKTRDLGSASQIRVGEFYLYYELKRQEGATQQTSLNTLYISADASHCKLVRIQDSFAGEEFSLSEVENSIGRTDENFILLSDASISRRHAQITRRGIEYLIEDFGSSNGTRLNSRPVKAATALAPGDIVEFGNVRFVFIEGDAQVDHARYATRGPAGAGRSMKVYAGAAIAAVVFLAGGVALFMASRPEPLDAAAAEDAAQAPADPLTEAQGLLERRNWDRVLELTATMLAKDPANAQATQLRDQAARERDAAQVLDKGESLSEQGQYTEALALLRQVPADTVAASQAGRTIAHLTQTLAHQYKGEAQRLALGKTPKELKEAHGKIVEALGVNPDDLEARELVTRLESELKKRRVSFEPWTPP